MAAPGMQSLVVLIGALALSGCATMVRDKPVTVPGLVKQVVVKVDHGNVEIVAHRDVTLVEITRTSKDAAPNSGSQHQVKDGVLTLEGSCGASPKCRVNHRVRVPLDTAVTITVRDGDVALMDIAGDIDVEVGLGNVSGLRLTAAKADVSTEGGNIDLIFAAPPDTLTVNAAAGDIDLRVPSGNYRCDLDKKAIPPFDVKCMDTGLHTITAATAVGRLSLHATD